MYISLHSCVLKKLIIKCRRRVKIMKEIKNNKVNNIENILKELEQREDFHCLFNVCGSNKS